MDARAKTERLRSFLIGGVVGASAVLAAVRRKRARARQTPPGLAAFEDAPCYRETLERERRARGEVGIAGDAENRPHYP